MFRELTSTWRKDLQKAELLAVGDRAKVEFLFPVRAGTEVQPGSNAWVLPEIAPLADVRSFPSIRTWPTRCPVSGTWCTCALLA